MNTSASNTPTGNGDSPAAPSRMRKILRFLKYAVLALAVILVIAHFVWVNSGSNQWELIEDREGVKVWTLKAPGEGLLRVRSSVIVKSKLAGMVKLLEDLDSCVDANCYDAKEITRIESVPGRSGTYVQFKFDIPGLKIRQYVLFAEHYQDPVSKKLEINIIAAPNHIPRDPCCVRITHLHNTWKLTPYKNGELGVELTQDTDIGGWPYFAANAALKFGMFKVMHDMQALMDKDRYKNAKVDYIQELPAQ